MRRSKNRFRRLEKEGNARLLEKALSFSDRVLSRAAFLRLLRWCRRWSLFLVLGVVVLCAVVKFVFYSIEMACSMSIGNIRYESSQNIISKEQALSILDIKGGSVNVTTFDAAGMQRKLLSNPCIADAHIRAEFPDTLSIEVEERIPVVYVEMEHAADTGQRHRLFMDPKGVLFPVVESYHENFMGVPVWYLRPGDVQEFKAGAVLPERVRRPIVELVTAANLYNLAEIPAIREIFRPKPWKILAVLDGSIEVEMQVYDIKGQMERLYMILEHARAVKKHAREINVIPHINPTVRYVEDK